MVQHASIARPAEGSLIAAWEEDPRGTLQMTGAEAPLVKEEQDLLDGVHRFAAEVMRPVGERLDRMTPEEVIAKDSPLWQVFDGFGQLGVGVDQLLAFEPAQAAKAACLILEELGWGDGGLARQSASARADTRLETRLLGDDRARARFGSARSQQADLPLRRRVRPSRLRGDVVR